MSVDDGFEYLLRTWKFAFLPLLRHQNYNHFPRLDWEKKKPIPDEKRGSLKQGAQTNINSY